MTDVHPQAEPAQTPIKPVLKPAAAKRANASVIGMVLALLVSLAVVIPVLLLSPGQSAKTYRPPVDVSAISAQAKDSAGYTPAAPALPAGWSVNYARWTSAGADGVPYWEVGYVTADQHFISLTQTNKANPTWVAQRTDNATGNGTLPVGSSIWDLREKSGGDTSLINAGTTTIILKGDAQMPEFQTLAAAALGTQP
ncbi:MAG: DUF4245 domain-containing protein [Acidobacteria bacterium]|nr:DUF4245 domain-containing protein [Acidobacteriota bacterium]